MGRVCSGRFGILLTAVPAILFLTKSQNRNVCRKSDLTLDGELPKYECKIYEGYSSVDAFHLNAIGR